MDNSAKLFKSLWACVTLDDVLSQLKQVPHQFASVGARRNNKSNIKTNSDSVAAIIEACTNGHDAAIRLWKEQKCFAVPPQTVNEALSIMADANNRGVRNANPMVFVLMHLAHGGFKKNHAVTVIDEGIGMDEAAMLAGPLAFGSEDKVLDATQFGSFGQGGASLFGHSKCSIVASRRAGSNTLVYTVVWLDRTEPGRGHSFVYLTQPNGKLFSFDARTLPHSVPSVKLAATLAVNGVIIPPQGTIRRQLQIEGIKEYWSTKDYGLYNGLQDRLFGVPTYVRLAGDDDPGHMNNRRGRQYDLDAVAEGSFLPNHKGAKLLKRLPPIKIALHRRAEPIGFARIHTWVVSSWMRKEKNKAIIATPVRAMLEGPESAIARSIFVTYNGQTLARLSSTTIFSMAGLRAIAENTIMRVEIDQLDAELLQDAEAFLSNREGLYQWFENQVRAEVIRYLRAQDELKILALEMEPPDAASSSSQQTDLSKEMNKFLQEPIFGRGLGYGTNAGDNSSPGGANGVKANDAKMELVKVKKEKKQPQPIVMLDPPTKIEILKRSVVRHATNYVTVHLNGHDYLAPLIKVFLPPFLTLIDRGTLHDGRMTMSVACDDSPLGTTGVISVHLSGKGYRLEDQCSVEIVPRQQAAEKKPIAGETKSAMGNEAPPVPDVKHIAGPEHPLYSRFFPAAEPSMAGFNYYLDRDANSLKIGIHIGFQPLLDIQEHLAGRYGSAIAKDYLKRVSDHLILNSLCCCRNSMLTENGAVDETGLELLTDITRGTVVYVGSLYSNRGFRNAVLAGLKNANDDN